MGKKKVIKQTTEQALEEKEVIDSAVKKSAEGSSSAGKALMKGKIYINASYNNTLISVADAKGNIIAWSTAGSLGFKGPKKATPFAATRVAEAVLEKLKKTGLSEAEVLVKGVGSGRESAIRFFSTRGIEITSIKDVTPIPHNGPRPPKVRRV